MKFNLKKLMIVLTVAMLVSANIVEAKAVTKKSIQECIKAAACEQTLKKYLKDNGHEHIAKAFEDVKCEKTARAAVKKLAFSDQIKVIAAITDEQEHLKKILPTEEKATEKTKKGA